MRPFLVKVHKFTAFRTTPASRRLLKSGPRGIGRQIRRTRRQLLRVSLHILQHNLDGLLELRILSFDDLFRAVFHHDVGLHPAILDDPLAVQVVAGELWARDIAAIQQRYGTTNATYPSPGALANERSKFVL